MAEASNDRTGGPTEEDLRLLLDAEQHRGSVEERRRRRSRRQHLEEALSFDDVLGALSAHRAEVSITTTDHGELCGQLVEVGRDYVALRTDGAPTRLVPRRRLASIEAASTTAAQVPASPPLAAPTGTAEPLDLSERLRELLAIRSRLQLTAGGSTVPGRVRRVGTDVVVLEQAGRPDRFVALTALDDVVVWP
jgi:hypothetical protein